MAGVTDGKAGGYSSDALDEGKEELAREASMLFSAAETHLNGEETEEAETPALEALKLFRELGDRNAVADTLRLLVGVYRVKNETLHAEEVAKEALERFEECDDVKGEAVMLLTLTELTSDMLTKAEMQRNRMWRGTAACEAALQTGKEARALLEELGEEKMEAAALLAMCGVFKDMGRAKEALQTANDALVIYRAIGDKKGEGKALHAVAASYSMTAKWNDALKVSKLAHGIFQDLELVPLEAAELVFLGQWSFMLKDYEQTLKDVQVAAELFQKVGSKEGDVAAFGLLVQAHGALGDQDAVLAAAEEALARYKDANFQIGEAAALEALVNCYMSQGERDVALDHAKMALPITREIGDQKSESTLLYTIAKIELEAGKPSEAFESSRIAVAIIREMQDEQELANVLINSMVQVQIALEKWEDAFKTLEEAQQLSRKVGDKNGEALGVFNTGQLFERLGILNEAQGSFRRAQELFQEAGDQNMAVHALHAQSNVAIKKGDPDEAVRLIHEAHIITQKEKAKELEARVLMFVVQAHFAVLQKFAEEGGTRESRVFTDNMNKAEKAGLSGMKLVERMEDKLLRAEVAHTLSEVYFIASKLEDALDTVEEAIKLYNAGEVQSGECSVLVLKAHVLQYMGRLQDSLAAAEKALELAVQIGNSELQDAATVRVEAIRGKPGQQQQIEYRPVVEEQVQEAQQSSAIVEEKPKGLDPLIVGDMLHGMLREMVGVQMESDTPFMDAGVDSLMSIEFRSQVNQAFMGLGLASTLTFDYPTIRELTSHIVEKSENQ